MTNQLLLFDLTTERAIFRPLDNEYELGIATEDWRRNGRPFMLIVRDLEELDLEAVPRHVWDGGGGACG